MFFPGRFFFKRKVTNPLAYPHSFWISRRQGDYARRVRIRTGGHKNMASVTWPRRDRRTGVRRGGPLRSAGYLKLQAENCEKMRSPQIIRRWVMV